MEDEAAADGDADAAADAAAGDARPAKPKHYTPVDPAEGMLMRLDSEAVPMERAYTGAGAGSMWNWLEGLAGLASLIAWPFARLFKGTGKAGPGDSE